MSNKDVIIICGPTASGKSRLAMNLASLYMGAIINADSMQIYEGLEVLTASPSNEDKKLIPHHLYNYLALENSFSVARYQKDAIETIIDVKSSGYLPIIVGGTGLYINSLINGINDIPEINSEIRFEAQKHLEKIGKEEFYSELIKIDPLVAGKILPTDKQRMIRAYEVIKQTGKSITYFQNQKTKSPLADYNISIIMLSPNRKFLYQSCNDRFLEIIKSGAMEEVEKLYITKKNVSINPLGFNEILSFFKGEISLEDAIILAQAKTRQYAKRQVTWFNNQIKEKSVISFDSHLQYHKIISNINDIFNL